MKIATTGAGNVVLVGSGDLPTDWNGQTLTVHELTEEQEVQYNALRQDRSETMFDGTEFTAVGTRQVL